MKYDAVLEEMWQIKREIGNEHPDWDDYVRSIFAFQEEDRRRGVKFVSFSLQHPEFSSAQTGG